MSDTTADEEGTAGGELVSRLRVIEDQPLDARAGAYGQIFEELRQRLDQGSPDGRA